MQDEVNTKVVAIAIKGGKITAEVLKKALAKFIEEIEKAEKQASQPTPTRPTTPASKTPLSSRRAISSSSQAGMWM